MYNLIYSSTAKEALKKLKKNERTSKTSQYNTKVQQLSHFCQNGQTTMKDNQSTLIH